MQNIPGNKDENGAHIAHPELFQQYDKEPGKNTDYAEYTSADGKYALAYTGATWIIQSVNNR